MQFAQRLRETADEELVTPTGSFRGRRALGNQIWLKKLTTQTKRGKADVDEETPSPA